MFSHSAERKTWLNWGKLFLEEDLIESEKPSYTKALPMQNQYLQIFSGESNNRGVDAG